MSSKPLISRTMPQYCQCRSGAGIAAIISDQVKKVNDSKHLKKAGINSDNLPLVIISSHICTCSSDIYASLYGPAVYNQWSQLSRIISSSSRSCTRSVLPEVVAGLTIPNLSIVSMMLLILAYPNPRYCCKSDVDESP